MLTYITPNGNNVFVGQNAAENDRLTLGANPNHIWLHAEGVAGAHVILDSTMDDSISIKFAKELALLHSKALNSKKVVIAYCGDVDKRKGSRPGEVYIRK